MIHKLCAEAGVREADALVMTVSAWHDELTPAQWRRINARLDRLCDELRIYTWSRVLSDGIENLPLAKTIHKQWGDMVLKIFGYPVGDNS